MLAQWRPIPTFPGYSISDTGLARNDDTGIVLRGQVNQRGVVNVGLTKNRVQYKRSVPLLVLSAFKPRPGEAFDCSINLDGDKLNNHVDNLAWRPKWFAISYSQQFSDLRVNSNRMIEDVDSGVIYDNAWHVAITHGLMFRDVVMSANNRTLVWPTHQRFRYINS